MRVSIIGAGVAGLTCACELVDRGVDVTIYEKSAELGSSSCSWFAGAMLAPWCEAQSADAKVVELGVQAKSWWSSHINTIEINGSLVLSFDRDQRDLNRFARMTENRQWLDNKQISALEPDLADRFEQGLFFQDEAHLDARKALIQLSEYLLKAKVNIQFGHAMQAEDCEADYVIDCRGFEARDQLPQLRGVKGEMLILKTKDIQLSRAVRLVHPRYPIYLVPREDNLFMLGATMIENDERNRISARSMLELLSSAYALHPAFAEAEIVEIGVDVRPAYQDNLPRLLRNKKVIYLNGLYRHGFLLSPAMAKMAADAVLDEKIFAQLKQCA